MELWFDGGVDTNINPRIAPVVQKYGRKLMCHSCTNFTQDFWGMCIFWGRHKVLLVLMCLSHVCSP